MKRVAVAFVISAQISLLFHGSSYARDTLSFAEVETKAEQGDAIAQTDLGLMYAQAEGKPQNYGEAVRWWRRAADQGFARGQFNLGQAYHRGEGVAQDDAEAVKWWRKAAEQGHAKAQTSLGVSYSVGRGVTADLQAAHFWLSRGAAQGNENARLALALVEKQLTAVRLSKTQKAAAEK